MTIPAPGNSYFITVYPNTTMVLTSLYPTCLRKILGGSSSKGREVTGETRHYVLAISGRREVRWLHDAHFRSVRVWQDDMPVPVRCRYPTLQNVTIPTSVIVRCDQWRTTHFDVYHFRNERIKEHLTVCLGKRDDGSVSFFFIQRGRVFTSEEEISSMEPFPYQLTD